MDLQLVRALQALDRLAHLERRIVSVLAPFAQGDRPTYDQALTATPLILALEQCDKLRWVSERLEMGHYTRVTGVMSRLERRPGRELKRMKRRLSKLGNGQ